MFNSDITPGADGGLGDSPSLLPASWVNPFGFEDCVVGSWGPGAGC